MKLLRHGPVGQERPGMLDTERRIRDLSGHIPDLAAGALEPARLASLRARPGRPAARRRRPRLGSCVTGTGKFICIGLNSADHAAKTGMALPVELGVVIGRGGKYISE